jgi:serine phosphatase RsbU (regulator of sigma subunit)
MTVLQIKFEMKNNLNFKIPGSLFASAATGYEISEASESVVHNTINEINTVRQESLELTFSREENQLNSNFWTLMPVILEQYNLSIRKFSKHYRSCIITETEIYEMAGMIHSMWMEEMIRIHPDKELIEERYPDFIPFERLDKNLARLYFEYVYIIPIVFRKSGYEIIRKSEAKFLSIELAEKLARVIHSRYRKSMESIEKGSVRKFEELDLSDANSYQFTSEFDDLSEDVKRSGIDNAYHIPTKLMAIGYRVMNDPDPDIEVPLLKLSDHEIETMARIEHDRWCWERRLSGWKYSPERDNSKKLHNCLIQYDALSEEEKEKDRILVRLIPYILKDIGIVTWPILPEDYEKIGYVKKEWGCISELKTAVNRLKAVMPEELAEKMKEELKTVDSSIESIKSSYALGKLVQTSFMPSILEFKEHLPDSFVLYKPKDIVSGDFFFIFKLNSAIILSASDCTGHGISAAILTSVCYSCLETAVSKRKITDPAKILKFVIPRIEEFFSNNKYTPGNKLGMDFTVCSFDLDTGKLGFSGFGNPLYYHSENELKVIKSISSFNRFNQVRRMISTSEIQLKRGDSFYIFSDGFADQEGENGKRFQQKRFRELLADIHHLSMTEQCEKLNHEIEEWRRSGGIGRPQTDDILVIGVNV